MIIEKMNGRASGYALVIISRHGTHLGFPGKRGEGEDSAGSARPEVHREQVHRDKVVSHRGKHSIITTLFEKQSSLNFIK